MIMIWKNADVTDAATHIFRKSAHSKPGSVLCRTIKENIFPFNFLANEDAQYETILYFKGAL